MKNKIVKLIAFALCIICAFAFTACYDTGSDKPDEDGNPPIIDNVGGENNGDDANKGDNGNSGDNGENNDGDNNGDDENGDDDNNGDDLPEPKEYFRILTLEDGKSYAGSSLSFDVAAYDESDERVPDNKISFSVDLNADDGVEDFVRLSGEDISLVWSDDSKTSYKILFTQGVFEDCKNVPMLFCVSATVDDGKDAEKTFRITYIGVGADGVIGSVVFSLEGFTVGYGYFAEPQYVTVYDGVPFSQTFADFLAAQGLTYSNTGSIQSGFYLEYISGLPVSESRIASDLAEILNSNGFDIGSLWKVGTLGELDFTNGSGWMYSVNGVFPNFGFSDYFPQDGDVVRVVFTLAYGSDIGGGWGDTFADFADYKEIMNTLAFIRANDFFGKGKETFDSAVSAVAVWNASQSVLDAQTQSLKAFYR